MTIGGAAPHEDEGDDRAINGAIPKGVARQRRWRGAWAAVPLRARGDKRFGAAHFRVMMAISHHSRSGAGCYAGPSVLALETGLTMTTVAEVITNLREWGYLESHRLTEELIKRLHIKCRPDSRRFLYRPIHDQPPNEAANDHSDIAE